MQAATSLSGGTIDKLSMCRFRTIERLTSSVGCHAMDFTSWVCSIITDIHSKSPSAWTEIVIGSALYAIQPILISCTDAPRSIRSCLANNLQVAGRLRSSPPICIRFRDPQVLSRIPIPSPGSFRRPSLHLRCLRTRRPPPKSRRSNQRNL